MFVKRSINKSPARLARLLAGAEKKRAQFAAQFFIRILSRNPPPSMDTSRKQRKAIKKKIADYFAPASCLNSVTENWINFLHSICRERKICIYCFSIRFSRCACMESVLRNRKLSFPFTFQFYLLVRWAGWVIVSHDNSFVLFCEFSEI